MTPDEVVTRARELEGERVRLTLDCMVCVNGELVGFDVGSHVIIARGLDVADIRPAPMRIEAGQRYADDTGRLFEGDTEGGLWELAAGYVDADDAHTIPGLHAVKVVDA